jgi:magnesium-transporting ATPase (P-type)
VFSPQKHIIITTLQEPDLAFEGSFRGFLFNLGTYLILMAVMIPISLYVSLEMAKLVQASFLNADVSMYYAERDQPAKARTTNLLEELGQVCLLQWFGCCVWLVF